MDRHGHRRRRHNHRHHHAGHQVSSFNLLGCMKLSQIKDATIKTTPGTASSSSSSCPPPKKNHHHGHHHIVTADPSSPKIGCMGQIKRKSKSSNSTSTISSSSSSSSPSLSTGSSDSRRRNKLFELKRAFKATSVGSQAGSRIGDDSGGVPVVVSVADLDPPLPVVRRPPVSDGNSGSLWERRCGGEALTGLQLEQPRLYLHATVV